MNPENEQISPEQVAQSIMGLGLLEIFTTGPRRLFIERQIAGHGTYRLYVSRPFGVVKQGGLRWRVQLTLQAEGQEQQSSLTDGKISAPLKDLGAIIVEAAERLDEHIKFNMSLMAKARRSGMSVVRP